MPVSYVIVIGASAEGTVGTILYGLQRHRHLSGFMTNIEDDIATLKARAGALRNLLVEPRQPTRRREPGRRINKPRTRDAYG